MKITLALRPIERPGPRSRAVPCMLVLLVASVLGQVSRSQQFGPGQALTAGLDGPDSVCAADLDGDGDQDVLAASSGDDRVGWFENLDGLGNFTNQRVLTTAAAGATCVVAADLDGDGDPDAVAASYDDDRVTWFENTDGLGNFGPPRSVTNGANGVLWVHAADLDGDGNQDLLVASSLDDEVAWFENTDGLGTFGPPGFLTKSADGAQAACAADLDGDGDLDVTSVSSGNDEVAWFENADGLGSFGPQQLISTVVLGPKAVCAVDLDGDGDQDVVSAGSKYGVIAWHENTDGAGSFGTGQPIGIGLGEACCVVAADLEGDGDPDLLTASSSTGAVYWLENLDGLAGSWLKGHVATGGGGVHSVFPADLDGDTDPDVLSAWYDGDLLAWSEKVDSPGTFASLVTISPPIWGPQTVLAADLDGDGDGDVLSASRRDDQIAWLENTDGLGTFGDVLTIATTADNASSVFAEDLDGDGDRDVLSASYTNNEIAWYENSDGLGSFGSERVITAGAGGARSVIAADLDGDGDADVLSASEFGGKVAWYENSDGLGSFGPERTITTSALLAQAVGAADLDGDGDLDALSASKGDNKVAWYANADGLGGFGPQRVITSTLWWAGSVDAADLDGDGDPDVLATSVLLSISGDRILWFENQDGQGSFALGQVLATSDDPVYSARAADLDEDGDQDVLASWSSGGDVAWFQNTDGLGSFGPPQLFGNPKSITHSVFAADLDGDGDHDVLSAAEYANTLSWYENLQAPLMADVAALSISSGGSQNFELRAGADHGLERYLLLGSLGGTSPGLPVNGHVLPLNSDEYFLHTVAHPNSATHVNTLGDLAVDGTASASFVLPIGLSPVWAGQTLHHAYALFDVTSTPGSPFPSFVSNAESLILLP